MSGWFLILPWQIAMHKRSIFLQMAPVCPSVSRHLILYRNSSI